MSKGSLILVLAGSRWNGVPMSEWHLVRHLSRSATVLWVDPALAVQKSVRHGADRRLRDGGRMDRVAPNVYRLTPITVPGVSHRFLRDVAAWQVARSIRAAVKDLNRDITVTIGAGPAVPLDIVPTKRSLLYVTDDWPAGAGLMGLDVDWVRSALRQRLGEADAVVTVSKEIAQSFRSFRGDAVVIPNGCDTEMFARTDSLPEPTDIKLAPPIAGFVGHLSQRIDLAMLEAVADLDVSLLMVGPRQATLDIDRLRDILSRPNVQWVGEKRFELLPSYIQVMDVGMTPYMTSHFNKASFPLKTLEYLAAGRPVVATDLPSVRSLETPLVTMAKTPEEFAYAVSARLTEPRTAGKVAERRTYAARHDWVRRAEDISQIIGLNLT